MGVYLAQPRINVVVCDLPGAARAGRMPAGWLDHNLFLGSSPAARIAVPLHIASSCTTQRAVAKVSRGVPFWVDY